ncbi:MAG: hypothetical protein RMJ53_08190 [Chitinophagales bacterium]|nr:hypothetical protein [Chitinophagales bacterium]
MEIKVIVYIILGIAYFIYTFFFKDKKEASSKPPVPKKPPTKNQTGKSVTLPELVSEFEKILKERQKQQTETAKPDILSKKTTDENFIVKEKKTVAYEEGQSSPEPVYERLLTDEELLHEERMKNTSAYNLEKEESSKSDLFVFDAKQAIISAIILERKF